MFRSEQFAARIVHKLHIQFDRFFFKHFSVSSNIYDLVIISGVVLGGSYYGYYDISFHTTGS